MLDLFEDLQARLFGAAGPWVQASLPAAKAEIISIHFVALEVSNSDLPCTSVFLALATAVRERVISVGSSQGFVAVTPAALASANRYVKTIGLKLTGGAHVGA